MRYPFITLSFSLATSFATLATSLNPGGLGMPAHAQTTYQPGHTQALSAERAITLIQNEAAIQLQTFTGNTEILEFSSTHNEQLLVGYRATVQLIDTDTQVNCLIDMNEVVQCNPPNQPIIAQDINTVSNDARCGPERPQETLLDHVFTQNIYGTLNDYSVRVYYNDDMVNQVRYLCMNVYDVRNQQFIGAMPARAASIGTVAYYSEQAFDGVDYQVILNPDGRYMFRRSQGPSLLYEGVSR